MNQDKKEEISSPRLWIKRVVLFASPEKGEDPIRDIYFHRGLNIVWGVELPDDAGTNGAHPVTLLGHSVGKTILCRLIRYCLGESTFGNPGVMSRIKYVFPKGWVGMELTLDGQDWVVVKPIGLSGDSKAARATTVENIFYRDSSVNEYRQFNDHLQNAMLSMLKTNAPPNTDKPYEWRQLLAWLARDQEARFQSLHDWRSPRSGAEKLKFEKPKKEHALYLIRLILDLVQDNELKLARELAGSERELKLKEDHLAELRRAPQYSFNEQGNALKRFLGLSSENALNADKYNLTSPVFTALTKIKGNISRFQDEIEAIDRKISQKRIWLASYDEQRHVFLAVISATQEGTESREKGEPEDDTIQKLRKLCGRDCIYGDVPFLQCSYVKGRLEQADKIIDLRKAREDKRVATVTEKRLSTIEQQRKDHDQIVALLNELRQKLNKDIAEKRRKEIELAGYREKLQRLDNLLEQFQKALDLLEGRTPNTELQQETVKVNDLRESIEGQKKKLLKTQEANKYRLKAIGEVYDGLIKAALSDTYSGALRMPKGELRFDIEEEAGLTGEAVETLALVLADVAAMICSCKGIGHHPRFLLHDSPREADLDRHIYDRYLRSMWELTNEYGGQEQAPFQYIVTTTSRPPDELESAICQRLKAHPQSKMLFGRLLKNPPLKKQISMFDQSGEAE